MKDQNLYRFLTRRPGVLFFAILICAIIFHCLQYLPKTPNLFFIVFGARFLLALSAGLAVGAVLRISSLSSNKALEKHSVLTAILLGACITAIIMTTASYGTAVPDGLKQLYIMH